MMVDISRFCRLRLLAPALMVASLAGCASGPTPYQPAGEAGYGFNDLQIESNRFRVSFEGNYQTPLATVQNYLLYHAAEVTKRTHNDYFIDVSQHIDTSTDYQTSYIGGPAWGGPGWGGGWYGGGWGGFGGVVTADAHARSRYAALMDIQLFSGKKPLDNLGPLVKRAAAGS